MTKINESVFSLQREFTYKNDKIKISYSKGDISDALSIYLIDNDGKSHHVYWNISPDRCSQSFNKISNLKIIEFVNRVISEQLEDQCRRLKEQERLKLNREKSENKFIDDLQDDF